MTTEYTLTPEELKAAARKLCKIRGISPYFMAGNAVATELAEFEIKKLMELIQAIDHAKAIP
ncbi:hypothetical protein [Polynucleobacter sp. UK-Kesae-W10]|uniref:hypothetical protein n=1 Tax=Polynucleobacter sp. UK-Kesae-W10 TaxID=1819738 RepID=UPI001C0DDC6D|nr:hypothetical protein [Polynucleobacter sp. UK-Kesae-W10]MBU3577507.1 hypothetical protein [Polynucleobacter sp. UK-Kesae-W10]